MAKKLFEADEAGYITADLRVFNNVQNVTPSENTSTNTQPNQNASFPAKGACPS